MRTALAAALCAGLTIVAPAAADAKTKQLRYPTAQRVTDQVSADLADAMTGSSDPFFVEAGWTYAPRRSCTRRTRVKITCEGNAYGTYLDALDQSSEHEIDCYFPVTTRKRHSGGLRVTVKVAALRCYDGDGKRLGKRAMRSTSLRAPLHSAASDYLGAAVASVRARADGALHRALHEEG